MPYRYHDLTNHYHDMTNHAETTCKLLGMDICDQGGPRNLSSDLTKDELEALGPWFLSPYILKNVTPCFVEIRSWGVQCGRCKHRLAIDSNGYVVRRDR